MKPEVPADFMDSVMQQIETKPAVSRRWHWIAAAASLLLLIGTGTVLMNEPEQDETTELPPAPKISEALPEPIEPTVAIVEKKPKTQPKRKKVIKPQTPRPEIPDTLGNGIWQSERNVERALQMLSECEAVIEKSEQKVRNNIVKATFNAVPRPANIILVTNEAGDYYVSDTNEQTIIEL